MTKTTILIADDQPLIRDGLAAILSMEDNYDVVAKAGDGEAAIQGVRLHRPGLVLMDIHMPKLDGLQAVKRIREEYPETKVLMLTTFEDEEYVWEALRSGASGYMVKGIETDRMLSTVADCLEGRFSYPASIQERLVRTLAASASVSGPGAARETAAAAAGSGDRPEGSSGDERLKRLTSQERNILFQLKRGKSNQAIAAELFLTTGTVKNYLNVIYRKLGVSSRTEAIAYVHEHE